MLILFLKILAWILIVLGILGVFLPLLPGTFLILIAGIILALAGGSFAWIPIILLFLFWLLSLVFNFLATSWGAKKMGATKYGTILAPIGAIFGFIFGGIIGLILGGIIFAIIGELLFAKKDLKQTAKSGFGVLIGIFLSQIAGIIIAITMIGIIIQFFI